jgi:hypothetical protein
MATNLFNACALMTKVGDDLMIDVIQFHGAIVPIFWRNSTLKMHYLAQYWRVLGKRLP